MKATFVKAARRPIYVFGKRVEYQGKPGSKRAGRTITKTDHSQPANEKDPILIQKGESYWWWQFAFRPKQYSRNKPRRSQLTQSEFLGWLYDMEDEIQAFNVLEKDIESYDPSDLSSTRDEWVEQINSQKEELEGKLGNMPDGLQESSVLNERIEALQTWADELEEVALDDLDVDDLKEQAEAEWDQLHPAALLEADPSLEDNKVEEVGEIFTRMKREKIDELLEELQSKTCEVG